LEVLKLGNTREGAAHEVAIIRVIFNEPENGRYSLANSVAERGVDAPLKLIQRQTDESDAAAEASAESSRQVSATHLRGTSEIDLTAGPIPRQDLRGYPTDILGGNPRQTHIARDRVHDCVAKSDGLRNIGKQQVLKHEGRTDNRPFPRTRPYSGFEFGSCEAWQFSQIARRLHTRVIKYLPHVRASNCIQSCKTKSLAFLGIDAAWQLIENRVDAPAGCHQAVGVGEIATHDFGAQYGKIVGGRAAPHKRADWQSSRDELRNDGPADESICTAHENRRFRHGFSYLGETKVARRRSRIVDAKEVRQPC
jgi:hypothetical protein